MKIDGSLRCSGFLALALLAGSYRAAGQDAAVLPFVSPIFGDNMVLQRDKPNTIQRCRSSRHAVPHRRLARNRAEHPMIELRAGINLVNARNPAAGRDSRGKAARPHPSRLRSE
jgi:hypothetical protein